MRPAFKPAALATSALLILTGAALAGPPATPVRPIGRALSSAVDTVVLSPTFEPQTYHNIFEVLSGAWSTTQRRLMFDTVRSAMFETLLLRSSRFIPDAELATMATAHGFDPGQVRRLASLLAGTEFYVLRPAKELPATLFGFDDAKSIRETYQLGLKDGAAGFAKFDIANLEP